MPNKLFNGESWVWQNELDMETIEDSISENAINVFLGDLLDPEKDTCLLMQLKYSSDFDEKNPLSLQSSVFCESFENGILVLKTTTLGEAIDEFIDMMEEGRGCSLGEYAPQAEAMLAALEKECEKLRAVLNRPDWQESAP